MLEKSLQINPKDNLIVALRDLKSGDVVQVNGESIQIVEDIPAKHKFAMRDLPEGEICTMYGVLVGATTQPVPKGGLIGTKNLIHRAEEAGKRNHTQAWTAPNVDKFKNRTFLGYHRKNGKVGTGNHWLVIPLVFCENRNVDTLAQAMTEELGFTKATPYRDLVRSFKDAHANNTTWNIDEQEKVTLLEESGPNKVFPNVDGLKFLKHTGGCGGASSDSEALCALLAGYITHPNVAGATVLSLGCQKAQIDLLKAEMEKRSPGDDRPVYFFEQQAMESEQVMMITAIGKTLEGLKVANDIKRMPAPLSELTMGTECGGSDGFSGISANPLVGLVSDRLAALGGTPVLSEFPELCGVEQNLVNRCESDELSEKFRSIIGVYSDKADAQGEGFHNNPSPGNLKDGLITDAIKSAGAALKGGSSPVCDVLDYTEPFKKAGLNLLCTPGNDVESTTALAGSGANVILFTTGLGTPTGNPVCPVIKISSNTKTATKLKDLIDFNAGSIIEGSKSLDELADELMELVIEVASGKATKAMKLQQDDFIPWKRGLSL